MNIKQHDEIVAFVLYLIPQPKSRHRELRLRISFKQSDAFEKLLRIEFAASDAYFVRQ